MEPLPELGSHVLCGLTPVHFDDFGNVDPGTQLETVFNLPELDLTNVQLQEFKPISPRGPPLRNSTPGAANFTVEVASTDVNKKKFLYSYKVGRIYVDKDCNFSVSFNWDGKQAQPDMYVRATVVFSDVEQSEKRVERCLQHFHESPGVAKEIAKNVLHSAREMGTQGVFYCGDVDIADSWYSVLVHYQKNSPEPCTHAYKFTCKSSCASGINRRAIAIIFTLEDQCGKIYGRQLVGVKVCACPRRDMVKDEETEDLNKGGKRKAPSNKVPLTKKIKLETQEAGCDTVVSPQNAVDLNAVVSLLKTMVDNMTRNITQLQEIIKCIEAPRQ